LNKIKKIIRQPVLNDDGDNDDNLDITKIEIPQMSMGELDDEERVYINIKNIVDNKFKIFYDK
jgi:hypothetical protein